MQIELSDKVQAALEKKATDAGMSVSSYANLIMEEQLLEDSQAAARRAKAIDALIEHMKTSTATSGRNGREWREFIHEGHND
jgi:uncharacterized protein with von Willebrand factor type A (vWA) domain